MPAMHDQPSINALWGGAIIEELSRLGVREIVIAPGSRSTPIVAAAVVHPGVRTRVAVDERGAAYLALGVARGSGHPAAVVTTSGTAVANLLPAVLEAAHDHVPLLLITADRPPELSDTGANQTTHQAGIFGPAPRWQGALPCPDDRIPLRSVLTTIDHAVARALDPDPGPVHLNCAFRAPLEPAPASWNRECLRGAEAWLVGDTPFTRHAPARPVPSPDDVARIAASLPGPGRGLVVAGTLPDPASRPAVSRLAARLGWPLAADIRSGLRLGGSGHTRVPHLSRLLPDAAWRPDAILQLGGRLVARSLQDYLDDRAWPAYVLVDPHPERLDPGHRVTERVTASPAAWCEALMTRLPDADPPPPPELTRLLARGRRIESTLVRMIDDERALTEPFVARFLTRHLPPGHALFLSSSMPIRDADRHGAVDGPAVPVAANRGVSGIDGVLATAIGHAVGRGAPVTLLIGDQALLHDLNSLSLLPGSGADITVVVINNHGGAIFAFLPIAGHEAIFSPWFDGAHPFDFAGVSAGFGVPHVAVSDRAAFADAHRSAAERGGANVIEVISGIAENRAEHLRIERAIDDALRELDA